MGISPLIVAVSATISAHYRDLLLCDVRADVTKTGNLSVEISASSQKEAFFQD
jgi:hypothetical protein